MDRGQYQEKLILANDTAPQLHPPFQTLFPVQLPDGSYLELPLLPLPPDGRWAIALLLANQTSFEIEDRLSSFMADIALEFAPEVIVGMPTLGLVYAHSVAKKLGLSRYVPLGYSRKFWYEDELSMPVLSITSPLKPKIVYIDPKLVERCAGKRVLIVDDVISTGGTAAAVITLLEKVGADIQGLVTAIIEGNVWKEKLELICPDWPDKVAGTCKDSTV